MAAVKFREVEVPDGTVALDGTAFKFCMIGSCDGDQWCEMPDEIELYRIIKASGARKAIDIARAIHAALDRRAPTQP